MVASSQSVNISRVGARQRSKAADLVAIEEPLEIQISSAAPSGAAAKSVSITMRTPGDDDDLALGFLFTEGIITTASQVVGVGHVGAPSAASNVQNIIRVETDPHVDLQLDRLTRHFYTTSSCGVCGKASLDAIRVTGARSLNDNTTMFAESMLASLPATIRKQQPVFAQTGGLHAAAVFGPDGEIRVVREDVGRHNATDKVIGALLREGQLPGTGCGLFVSGRASFELMQKALVAGIPLLVAVGAPSSLAVQTALEFGMTLVGFLREDKFNIYAGEKRIIQDHGE